MTTVVLFLGFAVILILGMPISIALLGGSLLAILQSGAVSMTVAAQKLFGAVDSFTLSAIPFFILAGALMSSGGIARRLTQLADALLGWLPGVLGSFPLLQVGLPAVLSLYFDLFSGLMQAFIFAMLTMLYIGTAAPEEE